MENVHDKNISGTADPALCNEISSCTERPKSWGFDGASINRCMEQTVKETAQNLENMLVFFFFFLQNISD